MEDRDSAVPATLSGVATFEQRIGPALERVGRIAERIGRLRRVARQTKVMNLLELRRDLEEMVRSGQELLTLADGVLKQLQQYRVAQGTFDADEWQGRFRAALHGKRAVEGEFPDYRIFPLEVRVDLSQEQVEINRRITRALHPEAVAAQVLKHLERLNAERFHPGQFLKALAAAYDLVQAENHVKGIRAPSVSLRRIWEVLSLRSGPRGYSWNQFGYDIYRLRQSGELVLDGRQARFGASRNRTLVLVSPSGRREVVGSLEFVPIAQEH
ncbi:MAG: hypothetical protein K6U14_07975 [Firmicutes bacterium]|nr:hypothetical protein [Alicyclobacillaceae bacterium]MCL6497553.1 hypothetical protein [Bacillota bacterium]